MTDYGDLTVHPFADAFPLISGVEFAELVEDIEKNGLREPLLVTHDGTTLVDGRNRYAACKAAGVELRTERLPEMSEPDLLDLIVSKNVHRRHLTPTERSILALDLEQRYAAAIGGRGARTDLREEGAEDDTYRPEKVSAKGERTAAAKAAKAVGASRTGVERAKRVQREDPELFDQMKAGEVTVTQASKKVVEKAKEQAVSEAAPTPRKAKTVKRPDTKVVESMMTSLGGIAHTIDVGVSLDGATTEQLTGWDKELASHMRALRAFQKTIKEKVASND